MSLESFITKLYAIQYKALLLVQKFGDRADNVVNTITIILSTLGIGSVIWHIGFEGTTDFGTLLSEINLWVIMIFGVIQIYKFLLSVIVTRGVSAWQVIYVMLVWGFIYLMGKEGEWYDILSNPYVVDAFMVLICTNEISRIGLSFLTRRSTPTILFAGSFLVFILIGTGLLLMPRCHYGPLTFLQALFTSTASVCVAGMSVVDVASTFTPFGHLIILILIQIGGLGVMTFTCFFALSLGSQGSLQNRIVIRDLISADNMSSIFETLKHIMYVTFIIEGLVAWGFYYFFRDHLVGYNNYEIVFTAIFHSVSAFCNGGVSNLPDGIANHHIVNSNMFHFALATTVILGAMGFPLQSAVITWTKERIRTILSRLFNHNFHSDEPPMRLISASNRLVFATNIILIIASMLFFLASEAGNGTETSLTTRITDAYFLSAITRTAGFSYTDLTTLTPMTVALISALMIIGGAPMSTAGGIKVTTFALACLNLRNVLVGRDNIEIFGRRVSELSVRKAFATIIIAFVAIALSTLALRLAMPGTSTANLLFESIAAISTTGLSLNTTMTLNEPAQIILIFDMFIGRIGVMAFLLIFITPQTKQRYKYPQENIML